MDMAHFRAGDRIHRLAILFSHCRAGIALHLQVFLARVPRRGFTGFNLFYSPSIGRVVSPCRQALSPDA